MQRNAFLLVAGSLMSVALTASAATRYVNLNNPAPAAPYTSWATAAANIQVAVDAAGAGDDILVTNGVYQTGARVVYGMKNRVAVTKAVTLRSVNGPAVTSIVGFGPNGSNAGRCVYLTNGAVLAGFTLTNGATQTSGNVYTNQSGGGVWCESSSAAVSNCVLTGNSAYVFGGGAYKGTLNNCTLTGNSAANSGGGAYAGALNNCTLTGNSATGSGGGAIWSTLNNCIVYYNVANSDGNYYGGTLNYCCTTPLLAGGTGNIDAEPQLADASHLSANSPCIRRGNGAYAGGIDIDGEPWANPPAIGSDEYWSGSVTGALSAAILVSYTNVAVGFGVDFQALIGGRASASSWDFGDGVVVSNRPWASHAWSKSGDYVVELRAYNASYPDGIAARVTVQVADQPVHYVALTSANPVPPCNSWATAATNLQDAVDVATLTGALILVTNGVYQTGAREVYGMSNRVAVTKLVIVRSVNGPSVTSIVGSGPIGSNAVRCVYLTNGAVLAGFTLTNGATQTVGDFKSQSGGGVWCESSSAVVSNCVLTGNSAYWNGGGAFWGTLNNCTVTGNSTTNSGGGAFGGALNNCTLKGNSATGTIGGGGASSCTLSNCMLTGNSAYQYGGGASGSVLNNCTLTGNSVRDFGGGAWFSTLNNCTLTCNSASSNGGGASDSTLNNCTLTGNSASSGGGVDRGTLNNCIIYYNTALNGAGNYAGGTFNYCCTAPLPAGGTGNIDDEPQLASASHLSANSPCIGRGSAVFALGVDLDDEPWANPPAIGCDEYWSGSVTGALSATIQVSFTNVAVGYGVDFQALIGGRVSALRWDFGDGVVVSNRPWASHAWVAPGDYVVELRAWNESYSDGIAANVTVHVSGPVHYVALASANPVPPYSSWATAATNIQDAIDMAVAGHDILVTNGVYQTGARAVYGMSNRVAVTKPVTVRSVNGPVLTSIVGYQVPGTTNGSAAVRCVYLTNGAVLAGFTLANGATQTSRDAYTNQSGGGIWCEPSAVVSNCVLTGNSAYVFGGGAFDGTLNNCTLSANSAMRGGGANDCMLNNCRLMGNSAYMLGGGAYYSTLNNCTLSGNSVTGPGGSGGGASRGTLNNCTLTGNSAYMFGGGADNCTLKSCIAYYNTASSSGNYFGGTFNYCCTTPLPAGGTGNIDAEPQMASASHLSANSPCIGRGSAAYAGGVDLDGEPWANPPAIGCDEYWSGSVTGALSAAILVSYTNVTVGYGVDFQAVIGGRASASRWDFGDGVVMSNRPYGSHTWAAVGDYVVELRAFNESYPDGIKARVTVKVADQPMHYVALTSANPVPPYSSWATAATNIQDAVDAVTVPGALVWVTNGVYQAGSRVVYGMRNRVAVTKSVTVRSVNGPAVTSIVGFGPSGSNAVRCVYLTNGAVLAGFTLINGATQTSGDNYRNQSGGGVWCESSGGVVSNCVLTGNSATNSGGGAYSGTLYNCTLNGNSITGLSGSGGGAFRSTLYNCTLTGNSASNGGGTYDCTLNNCIVYYNAAPIGGNYSGNRLIYCCTTPLPAGIGNFTNAPLFVDTNAWSNLRLQISSPCINAGNNAYAPGLLDLDGNPRISGGTVDLGAYEFQSPGSGLPYYWLQQYGLATDGSSDYADTDYDNLNNWQEWIAGTDPTNAVSTLTMLSATGAVSGVTVTWSSVTNRSYALEWATNLGGASAFSVLQSNIAGWSGTTRWTDTNSAGSVPRFYRVRVE